MKKRSDHVSKHEARKPKPAASPAPRVKPKQGGEGSLFDPVLIIRLVAATVIFAVALIVKLTGFVYVLLLALATIVAGYDLVLAGLQAVEEKDYFATPLVVVLIAAVSYIINFASEGTALVILYQIGLLLIAYADDRTRKSAMELLRYQDEETVSRVSDIIREKKNGSTEIESVMRTSSGSILKLAMVFGVLYAVFMPLISGISYTVSIHRALTILLIATPMSVVAAMPLTAVVGLCYSAQQGVVYNSAKAMEEAGQSNIAIFDKAGIFSNAEPQVLSVQSEVIDQGTFMDFAAHAVYYSEQPLAKAIGAIYTQEYKLNVISEFTDLPGVGVKLRIGEVTVVLATGDYFAERGVYIPNSQEENGMVFYMTVSDRYVGKIVLSDELNPETADLEPAMKEVGLRRCILLTEDGKGESQRVAEELGFTEFYGECDTARKLNIVSELSKSSQNHILYIYSSGIESHSAANVDMRVSRKAKYADAIALPQYAVNIPFSLQVCHRMREIAIENAVFAFVIKAILIFLSMIGYCNIWFAIFIDMVAAVATILNSIRVTNESLAASLKYKTGR